MKYKKVRVRFKAPGRNTWIEKPNDNLNRPVLLDTIVKGKKRRLGWLRFSKFSADRNVAYFMFHSVSRLGNELVDAYRNGTGKIYNTHYDQVHVQFTITDKERAAKCGFKT